LGAQTRLKKKIAEKPKQSGPRYGTKTEKKVKGGKKQKHRWRGTPCRKGGGRRKGDALKNKTHAPKKKQSRHNVRKKLTRAILVNKEVSLKKETLSPSTLRKNCVKSRNGNLAGKIQQGVAV